MTAKATVHVRCDWPGCYASADTYYAQVVRARQDTARQGWTVVGTLDFCGTLEQSDRRYADPSNILAPRGHAARLDHQPVVRTAGQGLVNLSCVCGWKFVSPYAWRPGSLTRRDSVGFRWGEHVEAEEKEAADSGPTRCIECGHGRTQHSRNGCTEPGCSCTVTYMDRDKFSATAQPEPAR
jgi:hypothetical protein